MWKSDWKKVIHVLFVTLYGRMDVDMLTFPRSTSSFNHQHAWTQNSRYFGAYILICICFCFFHIFYSTQFASEIISVPFGVDPISKLRKAINDFYAHFNVEDGNKPGNIKWARDFNEELRNVHMKRYIFYLRRRWRGGGGGCEVNISWNINT